MADSPDKKLLKLKNIEAPGKICEDFYIGEYKVRNEKYLPKYHGETTEDYNLRSTSTEFMNMYAPILEGIVGLVTKKDPELEGLDIDDFKNLDLQHNGLAKVIQNAATASLNKGISFVVAMTHTDNKTIFTKQFDYHDLYSYEIVDRELVQIVFKETTEKKKGKFGLEVQERFLVFEIGKGSVWFKDSPDGDIKEKPEMAWTNTLDKIPVISIITGKVLSDFEIIPKLYDIARMNMVHFNREGNIANLINVCSNPIPVIYGDIGSDGLNVGPSRALKFTNKIEEGFEYVEVTGESMSIIQKKAEKSEQNIDKLTFDLLNKNESKTVIDAEETRSKNTSFVKNFSDELETKFNILLGFILELSPNMNSSKFKLTMKKDFDKEIINIELAKSAMDSGDMSRETFYVVLRTGQLPKDFKIEEENDRINKELSAGPIEKEDES